MKNKYEQALHAFKAHVQHGWGSIEDETINVIIDALEMALTLPTFEDEKEFYFDPRTGFFFVNCIAELPYIKWVRED